MDIQLKDYTKEFHKSMVLDHINLELTDGKVYGLYGENGSGKTMLMRAISGLIYPKEGTPCAANHSTVPTHLTGLYS